jgi:hypothetical protein
MDKLIGKINRMLADNELLWRRVEPRRDMGNLGLGLLFLMQWSGNIAYTR